MRKGSRRGMANTVHRPERPIADAGFSLIEVMVSVAVIGVLMTSMSVFFVGSLSVVGYQRAKEAAVQVADDAVEFVRALPGSALADGRDHVSATQQWNSPAPGVAAYLAGTAMAYDDQASTGSTPTLPFQDAASAPVKLNGVAYVRHWYLGRCSQPAVAGVCDQTVAVGAVPFLRAVVAVTWSERSCPGHLCSYITATLVSARPDDAVFNVNEEAKPPAATVVGAQTAQTSQAVSLQLAASGGSAPLTWSGTNLPDGLAITSTGLISGTPTRTGTYTVTVTVVDAFGLSDTVSFAWTIVAPLQVTNPGNQTTVGGTAVNLSIASSGGLAPLTWSASGLPAGLTINSSTGTVSGTASTGGTYAVTVKASDKRGASRSVGFSWTVSAVASTYQSLVLADSPLGYWRLGETGGMTASDSSGNGWHGQYRGWPAYSRAGALTANSNTSIYVSGNNSGVTAPDRNDFVGTAPFSIEAWVRPTNLGASTDYKTLVRKYGGSGYWLWFNGTYGFGFERMSTNGATKVMVGPASTAVWQHVVVTYDGATVRIYVNGALRASAGSSQQISDNAAPVEIGVYGNLTNYSVTGDLDEVAIYGTALSTARVTAHYQKGVNG